VHNITDVDEKIIRWEREPTYLNDMRALRNGSVNVCARANDYVDQVISQIERCSRRARRHQGAQLDAQLVDIIHRLGGSTRTSLPRPNLCAIAHALSIWAYV
jgi:hypothetical protein